jgi:hypothetical protein
VGEDERGPAQGPGANSLIDCPWIRQIEMQPPRRAGAWMDPLASGCGLPLPGQPGRAHHTRLIDLHIYRFLIYYGEGGRGRG